MAKNENLRKAKITKNDEFYTLLGDIEKELNEYKDCFRNKVVYCNCDNPLHSNFWRYFHVNFTSLGLSKLVATWYDTNNTVSKWEYCGGDDANTNIAYRCDLIGNGDFASEECIEILKECDIVTTNPPFSLFRRFISLLTKYNKDFIIIGSLNAVTYCEVYPLIRENRVKLGVNHITKFITPEGGIRKFGNIRWFTNLPSREKPPIELSVHYDPNLHKKYSNYEAINVDSIKQIPIDYDGVMGVPITFLDHYSPSQFDLVSLRKGKDCETLVFTREREREREI